MPIKTPITQPANYVTPTAIGFADAEGDLALVNAAAPLPVLPMRSGTTPAPLIGQASSTALVGPFAPLIDAPVHLQISGLWTGQIAVLRSSDGGLTRYGLTAGGQQWAHFTGNVNEVVWQESEAGAILYLDISLTSGTVSYRVSQ